MADDLRKMQHADPDWFREPSRKEHRIGGFLFLGFSLFFFLLFPVLAGWWFRWVMLGLGYGRSRAAAGISSGQRG